MAHVQYYINLDLFHSKEKFMTFEKRIHEYPQLLVYHEFNIRHIRFHRATKGLFVGIHPFLTRQMDRCRRIVYKLKQIVRNILSKMIKVIRKIS